MAGQQRLMLHAGAYRRWGLCGLLRCRAPSDTRKPSVRPRRRRVPTTCCTTLGGSARWSHATYPIAPRSTTSAHSST